MNYSLTKPEWDLEYQVLLSSFFVRLFRSRATELQSNRRLGVGCIWGFFGPILWT